MPTWSGWNTGIVNFCGKLSGDRGGLDRRIPIYGLIPFESSDSKEMNVHDEIIRIEGLTKVEKS
jgi:hypothetical protein